MMNRLDLALNLKRKSLGELGYRKALVLLAIYGIEAALRFVSSHD